MDFKKILKEAIKNNTKIIITGKSGWGKSEMIQQVAQEEGLELIDFRLSEVLPEDIVGVPKVKDEYYEYVPPKWLYDVISNPDKQYLLFLDEITQGTPEVLNICYKIFDKVTKVGNYELKNVAVVGATNYSNESNYLSELPEPLKKRACMLELEHNVERAEKYLMGKYKFKDQALEFPISEAIKGSNPRSVDKAISLIINKCSKELVIPFIGYQNYQSLATLLLAASKPDGITHLDEALYDLKQGFIMYGKEKCRVSDPAVLTWAYNLTDEETAIIEAQYNQTNIPYVEDATNNFFTLYAINNSDNLRAEDLMQLSTHRGFNAVKYLTKMSMNEVALTNQYETLKALLNKDDYEICYMFCQRRTPTIQFMRLYKDFLPWDLLKEQAKQGYLTENKMREFKKELGL